MSDDVKSTTSSTSKSKKRWSINYGGTNCMINWIKDFEVC